MNNPVLNDTEFIGGSGSTSQFNGAPCAYFDGLYQYFNAHYK